jgi:hypothetical protein
MDRHDARSCGPAFALMVDGRGSIRQALCPTRKEDSNRERAPSLCQLRRGHLAQLVIDQRQELLCGGGIAFLKGRQNAGNLTH